MPFDTNHVLIGDEEGLRDGLTAFTVFDGYPQPLAGKIVLAGLDGSHVLPPQISIEEAAARLNVCKPVLDPVFAKADEHSPNGVILGGALIGFQTCITRTHPTVMAGVVQWSSLLSRTAGASTSARVLRNRPQLLDGQSAPGRDQIAGQIGQLQICFSVAFWLIIDDCLAARLRLLTPLNGC